MTDSADLLAQGKPGLGFGAGVSRVSIRTVLLRKGGRIWYDDRRHVHQQIFAGDEELDYAFMGTDPSAPR